MSTTTPAPVPAVGPPGASPRTQVSRVRTALAADKLGAPSLIHFGLTAATPLTVIAGGVVVMFALAGQITIPAAYIVVALALLLFAVGFTAMARHITNAGAFYAYVAAGLGKASGVGAAWIAAASYSALQISLYGLLGLTAQGAAARAGLDLPWWVAALAACAVIGVLGTRAVGVNGRILAVLLGTELAVVIVFTVSNFVHPAAGTTGVTLAPFDPQALVTGPMGAVIALAVIGYVGFESPSVYAEEARDRTRTVRKATFAIVAILSVVYIAASWSIIVAAGPDQVVAAATDDPNLMFTLAAAQLGAPWAVIGEVLLLTSIAAAALSFHNTTARYVFSLGREKVLPGRLGRTSARSCAPAAASLTQTTASAVVIVTWAVLGLDPLVHLFYYLGTSAGIGLIAVLAVCAVAVVMFFARDRRGETVLAARVAPVLAVVVTAGMLWLSVLHFGTLLGVAEGHWLPRLVPVLVLVLGGAGIVWALILRRARPVVYAGIGQGAGADVARTRQGAAGGRS